MKISITLVNKTNTTMNTRFVIFPKNIAENRDNLKPAWKVFGELDQGGSVVCSIPTHMYVGSRKCSSSAHARICATIEPVSAKTGSLYGIMVNQMEACVKKVGYASARNEIQVRNDVRDEVVNADLYLSEKDSLPEWSAGLPVPAASTRLESGETGAFELEPTIFIGVSWTAREGDILEDNELFHLTEIPLLGIKSADVIATGGGKDYADTPIHFGLENIKR